jgi:hypothetical protein
MEAAPSFFQSAARRPKWSIGESTRCPLLRLMKSAFHSLLCVAPPPGDLFRRAAMAGVEYHQGDVVFPRGPQSVPAPRNHHGHSSTTPNGHPEDAFTTPCRREPSGQAAIVEDQPRRRAVTTYEQGTVPWTLTNPHGELRTRSVLNRLDSGELLATLTPAAKLRFLFPCFGVATAHRRSPPSLLNGPKADVVAHLSFSLPLSLEDGPRPNCSAQLALASAETAIGPRSWDTDADAWGPSVIQCGVQ